MPLSNYTRKIFADCKTRSEDNIAKAREVAQQLFGDATEFVIGVNGSYARREATRDSDIDCFFLATNIDIHSLEEKQAKFQNVISGDLGFRPPASGGIFDKPLPVNDIYQIGGEDDSNETLTKRMLLLLEGEWLINKRGFDHIRKQLLEQYLYDAPGKDKICMFLLNDIIRYWRTICTDLEHKIRIQGKARPIRIIKLRFSRMLLYVSGVLTIGKGYGLCYEEKVQNLTKLFGTYPIDRVRHLAREKATPALDLYAEFLEALDTPDIRQPLGDEDHDNSSQIFDEMTEKARQFRNNLHCLFNEHFAGDNPTLRALLL